MTDSITRILVPVDFSAHSDRAVHYAATLAGQVGASVELLHVVDDLYKSGMYMGEVFVPSAPDTLNEVIGHATRRLGSMKDSMFPHGTDVQTEVGVGRPPQTIVERARNGGFDLIVMGTHGRTGFSHLFLGSVAERVVRMAGCPVLTVHRSEDDAAPPTQTV